MAQKQTAGRDRLGKLAPQFAALNDDVLFGEVWAREEQLSARDRSMITIAALFSAGLYPPLKSHLVLGKAHGIITRRTSFETRTFHLTRRGAPWCARTTYHAQAPVVMRTDARAAKTGRSLSASRSRPAHFTFRKTP